MTPSPSNLSLPGPSTPPSSPAFIEPGAELDAYVGLPFLDGGRTRAGLDCWGLVWLVYAERLGIDLPVYAERYTSAADRDEVAAVIRGELGPWTPVVAGQERPLDAVLLSEGGVPRHVGLVAGAGLVLHAEPPAGAVIERASSARLRRRVLGVYRHALAR